MLNKKIFFKKTDFVSNKKNTSSVKKLNYSLQNFLYKNIHIFILNEANQYPNLAINRSN